MTKQEKAKDARLRRTYKITLDEFNARLEAQDYKCAICNRDLRKFIANVDHDHSCCKPKRGKKAVNKYCGKCNRGLICYLCNRFAVGLIEWCMNMKEPIPVDKALEYILNWKKRK